MKQYTQDIPDEFRENLNPDCFMECLKYESHWEEDVGKNILYFERINGTDVAYITPDCHALYIVGNTWNLFPLHALELPGIDEQLYMNCGDIAISLRNRKGHSEYWYIEDEQWKGGPIS